MNIQKKQRLIGILAVVAVVAIFLPFLLHHSDRGVGANGLGKIPGKPSSPEIQLQLPQDEQTPSVTKSEPDAPTTSRPMILQKPGDQPKSKPEVKSEAESKAVLPSEPKPKPEAKPGAKPGAKPNKSTKPAILLQKPETAKPESKSAPSKIPSDRDQGLNLPDQPIDQRADQKKSAPKLDTQKLDTQKLGTQQDAGQAPSATRSMPDQRLKAIPSEPTKSKSESGMTTKPLMALKTPKKQTKPRAKSQARNLAGAWTIQLGAFGNRANATRLVGKLRRYGFDAYVRRERHHSGQVLTKVFVGPQLKRARAEQKLERLEELFNTQGIIKRYKHNRPN